MYNNLFTDPTRDLNTGLFALKQSALGRVFNVVRSLQLEYGTANDGSKQKENIDCNNTIITSITDGKVLLFCYVQIINILKPTNSQFDETRLCVNNALAM